VSALVVPEFRLDVGERTLLDLVRRQTKNAFRHFVFGFTGDHTGLAADTLF
jgi:hypothetical protein